MSTFNKATIVGRLGKDVELSYLPSGTPVANLSMATNEGYTDQDGNKQERTEWHKITVFGKNAENCSNYLKKGSLALVEGPLQTRKWQDQQGTDRYTTEIRGLKVVFLSQPQQQGGKPQQQQTQQDSAQGEGLSEAFPSEAGAMDEAPF